MIIGLSTNSEMALPAITLGSRQSGSNDGIEEIFCRRSGQFVRLYCSRCSPGVESLHVQLAFSRQPRQDIDSTHKLYTGSR